MFINGIKILGGIASIQQIITEKKPDLVIISTSHISNQNVEIIKNCVGESNISLAFFKVSIEPTSPS